MRPLQTSALAVTVPAQTNFNWRFVSTTQTLGLKATTACTVNVTPDYGGALLYVDNQLGGTINLPQAALLPNGWQIWIINKSLSINSGQVTITPAANDSIANRSTQVLQSGEGVWLVQVNQTWEYLSPQKYYLYDENAVRGGSAASATGLNAIALGLQTSASGQYAVAIGSPSAAASNSYAVGIQGNAGSSYSTAIGYNSGGTQATTVTKSGAMALGGSYASGTDSFAAAITNNTSSYGAKGTNSIAIGKTALASGSYAIAIGVGFNAGPQATTIDAIAIGDGAIASSLGAVALGSYVYFAGPNASQTSAVAIGPGATSAVAGKYSLSPADLINGVSSASQQYGLLVLTGATTNTTPVVLQSDGTNSTTPGTTNQVILPNSTAFAFTGTVVARQQAAGGTASAAWTVQGLIRREGSAGTTTLVASTVTAISNVPGWTLALSADTTNGGLAITATGAAATNIRWVANIQTSEVLYA